MKFKTLNRSKGFSLIELMIVVGIVGVLAAIAIPNYQDSVRKARRTDAMDALTDCASVQARNYSTAAPPTYLNQAAVLASGACNGLVSKDGYYTIRVTNPNNCNNNVPGGGQTFWCFQLTATPVANTTQANDALCATMTLDYRGRKSATGTGGDTTDFCWRS